MRHKNKNKPTEKAYQKYKAYGKSHPEDYQGYLDLRAAYQKAWERNRYLKAKK